MCNTTRFAQADVAELAPHIIDALLAKIEKQGTPEKVAENDYLMKCLFSFRRQWLSSLTVILVGIMRVIMTARSSLAQGYERILQRFVAILGNISRNPSNPNFDQYIFESISALMRFIVAANPASLPTFEQALFGPATIILQQDIDRKYRQIEFMMCFSILIYCI